MGYVAPADKLAGRGKAIKAERQEKLALAQKSLDLKPDSCIDWSRKVHFLDDPPQSEILLSHFNKTLQMKHQ